MKKGIRCIVTDVEVNLNNNSRFEQALHGDPIPTLGVAAMDVTLKLQVLYKYQNVWKEINKILGNNPSVILSIKVPKS